MRKILLSVLTIFILITFFSKLALAEIATTRDWIGLFNATETQHNKSKTVTGCSGLNITDTPDQDCWVYANSCSRTADATPKLSDSIGCSNIIPNTLPADDTQLEYRMYAYDGEDADALIAKSNPMTVGVGDSAGGGLGVPCPTQSPNPRVRDGLISAPTVGNNFGNNLGQCASGDQAAFAPYKIPSYDDLKSKYFTQSKASNKPINSGLSITTVTDGYVYDYTASDVEISTPLNYQGTALIFIEGNIKISQKIIVSPSSLDKGLVFIVKGKVFIDKSVNEIDAVIISQNIIYTATNNSDASPICVKNDVLVTNANALVVKGSLVSLDSRSIVFCRKLADDSQPAEQINNQPKYLVILRDMMSDTLQKWSEIQ